MDLSRSQDKSYAYSQYIMWGLAEVSTAELIFCVPSFPLLFRRQNIPYRLFHYLQFKITMILFPERISNATLSRIRSATDLEHIPDSNCTWLDDGSDAGLTELQPIRIQGGRLSDQRWHSRVFGGEGILITTEIDIRTDERKSSRTDMANRGAILSSSQTP